MPRPLRCALLPPTGVLPRHYFSYTPFSKPIQHACNVVQDSQTTRRFVQRLPSTNAPRRRSRPPSSQKNGRGKAKLVYEAKITSSSPSSLPCPSPVRIPRPGVLLRPQLAVRHAEAARRRGPRVVGVHRAPRPPPAPQEVVLVRVPRRVALVLGVQADVRPLQLTNVAEAGSTKGGAGRGGEGRGWGGGTRCCCCSFWVLLSFVASLVVGRGSVAECGAVGGGAAG